MLSNTESAFGAKFAVRQRAANFTGCDGYRVVRLTASEQILVAANN